jgi:hypothetical protein
MWRPAFYPPPNNLPSILLYILLKGKLRFKKATLFFYDAQLVTRRLEEISTVLSLFLNKWRDLFKKFISIN